MRAFYTILGNSLAAAVVNNFVWFAVTFWVFLETRSVVATSVMAGVFTITIALSGIFLGSLVDRYPKKTTMMASSLVSAALYAMAAGVYLLSPSDALSDPLSPYLWAFIVLTLVGAMAGNLRGITLATLVTIMVPEGLRDRANGLVGTATGVAFMAASVFSGLAVGFLGIPGILAIAIAAMAVVVLHLSLQRVPDLPPELRTASGAPGSGVDLRGTFRSVRLVPGLMGLILFHTFNNFLGGIFMALMDAYGLLLVPVQTWGILWGFLSLGFIVGGLVVARRGLGRNPLRLLLLANAAMWTICIIFPLQASIALLATGMFVWLCLIPVVEAAEQTVLQKVVTPERQGRVFGFAQSVEQAATPITAFLIGPIAQAVFIPFMTTGAGVDTIGAWFGTGVDRGIALLFIVAGWIGLVVTLLAMRSNAYRVLSTNYTDPEWVPAAGAPAMEA
jgi:DHA3 family multidrug efflux protein-like MFS transporter